MRTTEGTEVPRYSNILMRGSRTILEGLLTPGSSVVVNVRRDSGSIATLDVRVRDLGRTRISREVAVLLGLGTDDLNLYVRFPKTGMFAPEALVANLAETLYGDRNALIATTDD